MTVQLTDSSQLRKVLRLLEEAAETATQMHARALAAEAQRDALLAERRKVVSALRDRAQQQWRDEARLMRSDDRARASAAAVAFGEAAKIVEGGAP